MEEFFYALLQDVYFAEKQLVKTLPKLAKNSANEKLQEAFINHYDETARVTGRSGRGQNFSAIRSLRKSTPMSF
jgi:ferritin-like metal-binding protein YciE